MSWTLAIGWIALVAINPHGVFLWFAVATRLVPIEHTRGSWPKGDNWHRRVIDGLQVGAFALAARTRIVA